MFYGQIISTIMGSTETTFYTIAIYTAAVKIKKIRYVLVAALCGDLVGMVTASIVCQIMGSVDFYNNLTNDFS